VARVIQFQRNPWGAQAGTGGEEPQRSDLWVVDMTSVLRGITTQLNITLPPIPSYFAQSVSIPELRVKADQFRRDSRPYNMPVFDEALDPVKITFILDAALPGYASRIYNVLDRWRSLVRAGRGSMSKETVPTLNDNYRIDFQFNVTVMLLRGGQAAINSALNQADALVQSVTPTPSRPSIFSLLLNNTSTAQKQPPSSAQTAAEQQAAAANQQAQANASTALLLSNAVQLSSVDNDLQYSGAYTLQNCWLGGFRISDLNYTTTQISTIEATLYAEDVFDQNGGGFE
jgi:hypothetical protein